MTGSRLVLFVAILALASSARAAEPGYAAPDAAVGALVAAVRSGNEAAIERVLGPGSAKLVSSGDAVADRTGRQAFLTAYEAQHAIQATGTTAVLHLGKPEVAFPIPLRETGGRWRFDARAGAEYILDRRIGGNELDAIETCRAIVDAERDYASADPSRSGFTEYAQHFVSSPGRKDGLYWPASAGGESPLGPLVATARAEGYRGRHAPYHGYYFKILTTQGPHAPGGARDYIVQGHMIGGFAAVAYPAKWADSGVMTFLVAADGTVFEKNLGPATARVASRMTEYDPDPSWHPAAAPQ